MIAEKLLERVIAEGKVFKVGNSFFFAAQIPDDSVGCSGSRCSCCNGKVAYCNHVCKHCGLPFVGPCGFPQLPHWEAMSIDMRIDMVEMVFNQ
ncbi:MAG: hypothetical protein Q8M12_00365, partial [bacterium]|nr:hypothetical protein [bacterium]